jgi:transcription initiation factor TFIIB
MNNTDDDKNIWALFDAIESLSISDIDNKYETDSPTNDTNDTNDTNSKNDTNSTNSTNDSDTTVDICSNCNTLNSFIIEQKEGFLVCNVCGMIESEQVDYSPEWNSYNNDGQSSARCGMQTNYFLPKSSLGTTISGSNYNRLKRLQNWGAMPYRERSLFIVLEDITARCQKYNIKKNIIDDAKLMYKKISECQHLKGKNKDKFIIIRGSNRKSLIAACVFYACKLNNNTQSPKEIAKIFDLKITEITKGCKKFLQLIRNYNSIYKLNSSTPVDFIKRYCNILNIHAKDAELAMLIANNIKKLGLASDHTPPSVAAGSILLMSKINNLSLTKKIISKKFSISEVTISKIYKKIEEFNKILVDMEQTEQFVILINSQA